MQFIFDDETLRRFGPDPDPATDDQFWENACRGMLREEATWKQRGDTFVWIDPKPVWVSAADWELRILPAPEKPGVRRFRLSLIGGGQIRVTETFKVIDIFPDGNPALWCGEPKLRVQAETSIGLCAYAGIISHGAMCEMATYAVVFSQGTPQDIADRTAATLRLIDQDADNFYALLARGERFGCCQRPLKDEISKLLGIGPDCARQMSLPPMRRLPVVCWRGGANY